MDSATVKAFARRAFAAPAAFSSVCTRTRPKSWWKRRFKIDAGGSVQRLAWGPRHFLRGLKCLVRAGYGRAEGGRYRRRRHAQHVLGDAVCLMFQRIIGISAGQLGLNDTCKRT